jgi:DNA-binding YbaB/EbfC family protein
MLKGLGGLGGLGDMGKLMKQAQEMQTKMTEAQERLANLEAEGSSGAGMVKAVATSQGELRSLEVDPSLLDGSHEKEVLEDLIVAAVNDAARKAREAGQAEMAKITEGLQLPPGMKLPFG